MGRFNTKRRTTSAGAGAGSAAPSTGAKREENLLTHDTFSRLTREIKIDELDLKAQLALVTEYAKNQLASKYRAPKGTPKAEPIIVPFLSTKCTSGTGSRSKDEDKSTGIRSVGMILGSSFYLPQADGSHKQVATIRLDYEPDVNKFLHINLDWGDTSLGLPPYFLKVNKVVFGERVHNVVVSDRPEDQDAAQQLKRKTALVMTSKTLEGIAEEAPAYPESIKVDFRASLDKAIETIQLTIKHRTFVNLADTKRKSVQPSIELTQTLCERLVKKNVPGVYFNTASNAYEMPVKVATDLERLLNAHVMKLTTFRASLDLSPDRAATPVMDLLAADATAAVEEAKATNL